MMDKYKGLISIFSDALEKSKDYHIAYIYQVGYVSLVGLLSKSEGQNLSMIVDEIFSSPEVMAESLLRNWRCATVFSYIIAHFQSNVFSHYHTICAPANSINKDNSCYNINSNS